ncbi:unnamed protein product, partial [Heterotrigona itama]
NTFVDLKQIIVLDLSRNMLTEIPANFGELKQLKHLDLYANQISRLPLSLSELKNLRWLDLKENPLTPAVASVAGSCSNLSECQACARNVVTYLSRVKLTIEEEKLRRLNAITADTETSTISTKKGGKKKKKKTVDKNNKQNLDKNGSDLSNKMLEIDQGKIEPPMSNKNQDNEKHEVKGKVQRFFMSAILWLFLLGLTFALIILILPLYSKQSEHFIKYTETTFVRLKEFQKYSTDIFDSFMQTVINICHNLYHAYERYLETETETHSTEEISVL